MTDRPSLAGKPWRWVLVLVTLTLVAYLPSFPGGFIWDDDAHVTAPDLRSMDGLRRIWLEPGATAQYYPLLHTVFWVEYKLWGSAPLGYHLVNVALHIGAAFLLFRGLRRLEIPGAELAALVFALHPVHVESVAWITELKNTLSAVFYLAAIVVYTRFDETRDKRSYGWALALFVLALSSKTVTATLPAALLVILWWRRGALKWSRDVYPVVPMLILGAVAGLHTAWMERAVFGAEGAEFNLTFAERLILAGRVPWFYLSKLLWPVDLTFIYPRWEIRQTAGWQYLFPTATLLTFAGLFAWRRRSRAPLAGALYFVGTLFPVLGFFNVYPFRYSFVADHFQYLASLGVIVPVTAWAVRRWAAAGQSQRRMGTALGVVLLGALTVLSYRQSATYASVETLYQTTIARNPACWMAHNNLGAILLEQGRFNEAVEHLQEGLRYKSDDAGVYNNLGTALFRLGKLNDALDQYQRAVQLQPDYPDAHYNLANALAELDRIDDAVAHYTQALRLKPDYAEAHYNLANTLLGQGRGVEATEHYQQAVRFAPGDADIHSALAGVLAQQGRLPEAATHYQHAVRLRPNFPTAHFNLANTLLHLGYDTEAVAHYRTAAELLPDSLSVQFNLATALLRVGQPSEAIARYQQILARNPDLATAHYGLAVGWAKLGAFDRATNACDRAVRLDAKLSAALADGAWLLATHEGAAPSDIERAVEWATRACRLTGQTDPAYLDTLAAAYAAAGQFTNAIAVAGQAVALAGQSTNAALKQQILDRLKLYRTGQPYRTTAPVTLPSDW
jgi:tetratricopeptide (TPR) repeat protein